MKTHATKKYPIFLLLADFCLVQKWAAYITHISLTAEQLKILGEANIASSC